tara:strand:- start:1607 stop:1933 length:327 start_codon:yes stop_codon:yes gene_type:complete
MKLEQGKFCPLIGKDCIGLQCAWFTQVRGMHPQTGEDIDEWDCAIQWMPVLLIENSRKQNETSAAVESFRNEMVINNENAKKMYLETIQEKLNKPRQIHNISEAIEEE